MRRKAPPLIKSSNIYNMSCLRYPRRFQVSAAADRFFALLVREAICVSLYKAETKCEFNIIIAKLPYNGARVRASFICAECSSGHPSRLWS